MAVWEWSYAGVTFGGTGPSPVEVVEVEGWLDLPDVRTGDTPRAARHGLVPGVDLAGGRVVRMRLQSLRDDPADLAAVLEDLERATVLQDAELALSVELPGRPGQQLWCRPRRRAHRISWDTFDGRADLDVEWFAADPRIVAVQASVAQVSIAAAAGGLEFPATSPFQFGTAGTTNTFDALNEGNFPASWVATFAGPLSGFAVEHLSTGRRLVFDGVLGAGEQLVVDSQRRTVMLAGTASRYGWLQAGSRWFELVSGSNPVRLSGGGDGSVSMTWRSTWL